MGSDTLENNEETVYYIEFGFFNPEIQFGLYSAKTKEEAIEFFAKEFGEFPEFHIRGIREAEPDEVKDYHRIMKERKKELN